MYDCMRSDQLWSLLNIKVFGIIADLLSFLTMINNSYDVSFLYLFIQDSNFNLILRYSRVPIFFFRKEGTLGRLSREDFSRKPGKGGDFCNGYQYPR